MICQKTVLATSIFAALLISGTAIATVPHDAVNHGHSGTAQSTHNQSAPAQMTGPQSPASASTTDNNSSASARSSSQDKQPTKLQNVVVTGSLIKQTNLATREPIISLNRQQLEVTGKTTVAAMLSQLAINGADTSASRQGILVGPAASIDLRNLGANRTLVLVNGQRWATGTNGAVNLNTIPSSIISRVEVLKDGASAIYGSDAIGGVVNIITKKHVNGAHLTAYYGENGKSDGKTQHFSFTLGTSSKKSSLLMSLNYTNVGTIEGGTRAITRYPFGVAHPHYGYNPIGPKPQFCIVHSTGQCAPQYVLNKVGDNALSVNNYHLATGNNFKDGFNREAFNPFRNPYRERSVYVQGHYNFTPTIKLHASALYDRYNTKVVGNPAVVAWTGFPTGVNGGANTPISADSIYNPTNQPIDNPARQPVGYDVRTMSDPSLSRNKVSTRHFDIGLTGEFNVGLHLWDWSAAYDYNKSDDYYSIHGGYNFANVKNATGPSFIASDGTPKCGVPGNVISGCVPWNVLGGVAAITPAVHNYIFYTQLHNRNFSTAKNFTATLSGGLWDIPTGGTLSFGLGAEHRRLSGGSIKDNLLQFGLAGNPVKNERGHYSVNAVYGELSVPVLIGYPGVQSLSFDLAGRFSNYSNFGSTFKAKYGFKYQPIEDVVLRGDYSQSFRAPSIDNLFAGQTFVHAFYTDPCDAKFGASQYGPSVHQACVASLAKLGVANPKSFRQLNRVGHPTTRPQAKPPHGFLTGSNPNLGPETAISRNLGIVYSPHQLPGFNVNLEWYSIFIRNEIVTPTPNDVLRGFYEGNQSFVGLFQRNSTTGQISQMNFAAVNAGALKTKGYDLSFNYRFSYGALGHFKLTSTSAYVSKFGKLGAGESVFKPMVGRYPIWRFRSNAELAWHKGSFSATWRARYFSGLTAPCVYPDGDHSGCNRPHYVDPISGNLPSRRTGAVTFNDVSGSWKTPWRGKITLGINNVFKKKLPVEYGISSRQPPVNPNYDIDRFLYVRYSQNF